MISETYRYYGPKQPYMLLYLGEQEEAYKLWMDADLNREDIPKPDPTIILSEAEMNELVVKWLTGPPGSVGAMGPMGMKGDPA